MYYSCFTSVVLTFFIAFVQSCTSVRATLIEWFGNNKPVSRIDTSTGSGSVGSEARYYSPTFSGLDLKRAKVPIRLKSVASGFQLVTDVQFIPGQAGSALIALKSGELYKFDFNSSTKTLLRRFEVASSSELGLLGIAFHPNFPVTAKLYLHFNPAGKEKPYESRIVEYSWSEGPSQPQLSQEHVLLRVDQPYANHNGGQIQFGTDGYLYIAFGDGGWRDDPHENGQNLESMLGKILRIDVNPSRGKAYSIPPDNPFVDRGKGVLPEIWAYGLRNPWRFTFNQDGRMVVADVGQNAFEEISIARAGENLGWNVLEGRTCFNGHKNCSKLQTKKPFAVYGREDGMSITGGVIAGKSSVPGLNGKYLFADFVLGKLWAVELPEKNSEQTLIPSDKILTLGQFPMQFSCFANHPNGQVIVADFGSGNLFEIVL